MNASSESEIGVERRQPEPWRFLVIGLAGSLTNLSLAFFLLPRFASIYSDMLSPSQVSSTLRTLLGGKWAFVGLAFFWPIVALWLGRWAATDGRRGWRYLGLIFIAETIQFFIPIAILLHPLEGIIRQMGGTR